MRHIESTFQGVGGISLYRQVWQPDGPARVAIVIVHGIGEHSSRYGHVVNHLVPQGYAIWAYDHRGHGRSGGHPVHVDRWEEYREDLRTFLSLVSEQGRGLPLFLYGHSMGGLIVLDYLEQHQEGLRGAILSTAAIQPVGVAKPHLVALARALSPIVPRLAIPTGLDISTLSRDPTVVQAYRADPLVRRAATVRFGTEALAAVARVRAGLGAIRLPVLIIHGGADRLHAPEGSRLAFTQIASEDKTLRIYPETYHEPHNDVNRDEVLCDVERWLEQRSIVRSMPDSIG